MRSRSSPVERLLNRLAHSVSEAADGDLLARFAATRDEASFAELVCRHRPMVERVARRIVGQSGDADDVAQAAFIVLARRAPQLAGRDSVGDWLHGVAVRTALRARCRNARRRVVESKAARPEAVDPVVPDDLAGVVDRAVRSLSANQREVVVLCDLQSVPRLEAARRLGIPEGTVSSRLASAHANLARRLRKSWPAVAAVLVSPALPPSAGAALTAAMAMTLPATGPAQLLALEVLTMMSWNPIKLALAGGMALTAALAVGVGVGVGQGPGGPPPGAPAEKPPASPPAAGGPPGASGGFGKPGGGGEGGLGGGKFGGGAPPSFGGPPGMVGGMGGGLLPSVYAKRQAVVGAQFAALQGDWVVQSITANGKPVPASDADRISGLQFGGGDKVTVTRRVTGFGRAPVSESAEMMVRLNPFRAPAELTLLAFDQAPIDALVPFQQAPGRYTGYEVVPHIYRLSDDDRTLTIARYRTAYPDGFQANATFPEQMTEQDRPRGFAPADRKDDEPELLVITLGTPPDTHWDTQRGKPLAPPPGAGGPPAGLGGFPGGSGPPPAKPPGE